MVAYAMQCSGPTACGRSLQAEKVDGQDAECVVACVRQEARRGVDVAAEESEAYGEHEDVAEQQRWTVLDVHRGEKNGSYRYPQDRLHGAAEECLLSESGAHPDQQGEDHRRDQAQTFRVEERLRDLTDPAIEVRLQLREQGVGGKRERERTRDKQYDNTYVHRGDGTVAEAGERLARSAADAGADPQKGDDDEGQLAGQDGDWWDPSAGPQREGVHLVQLLEPEYAYKVIGKQHSGEQPEGEKDRWVRPELPVRPAANDLQQRGDAECQPDQTRHRNRYCRDGQQLLRIDIREHLARDPHYAKQSPGGEEQEREEHEHDQERYLGPPALSRPLCEEREYPDEDHCRERTEEILHNANRG